MDDHEKDAEGDHDHIEKVRRRAHAIWLDQGMVHGRDQEHWHEAEREIAAEEAAGASPKSVEPTTRTVESTESPAKTESPVKGAGASPAKGTGEAPAKGAGESPLEALLRQVLATPSSRLSFVYDLKNASADDGSALVVRFMTCWRSIRPRI